MERGAEPWSWALEASSARSHDFHPGVGPRREGPLMSHQGLSSGPSQGESQSACSLEQEGSVCMLRSGFGGTAWPPIPSLRRL